jgi:DNA-binding winged helix-turn-helix (wHTH) protein/Flp pilus assembly protein TadD
VKSPPVLVFGPYRLETAKRILWKHRERLVTPPKVFDALVLLVENRDRVVSKEELVARVWPDVSVTDASLKQLVASLRRLLEDGGGEYVETVPKVGYRFSAEVSEAAPPGRAWHARSIAMAAGALVAAVVLANLAGLRSAPRTVPGVPRVHGTSPEVRALLVRGRRHWLDRSGDGLYKSMLAFRKASELDPKSAEAWAGLADAYAFDKKRWQEAEAAARKALALSPALASPHATLGFVQMAWRWDMVAAGRELTKAIEADREDATARQWHALYLTMKGQLPEAQLELEETVQRHPASLPVLCDLARVLYTRGLIPEARKALAVVSDLDPSFVNAKQLRLEMAIAGRDLDEAVSAYLALTPPRGDGDHEARRREASELGSARFLKKYLQAAYTDLYPDGAGVLVALGERDAALDWLEACLAARAFLLPNVRVDPLFAPLRGDPRFEAFLTRLAETERTVPPGLGGS